MSESTAAEYILTTDDVRNDYAIGIPPLNQDEAYADFDRWLADHDAAVALQAKQDALTDLLVAWPTLTRDMVSRGYVRGWLTDRLKAAMEEPRP